MTAPSSPGTPSMEKRVLQAVLLSLAVLLVYQSFFAPRRQPQQQAATPATAEDRLPPRPRVRPVRLPRRARSPAPPALPASLAAAGGARIVVESDEVRAEFSTRGAVLLSWTLKRYPGAHGHALDLLPTATDVNALPAFSLTTSDETVSNTLASANFTPSAQTLDLRGTGGRTLRFDYEDAPACMPPSCSRSNATSRRSWSVSPPRCFATDSRRTSPFTRVRASATSSAPSHRAA